MTDDPGYLIQGHTGTVGHIEIADLNCRSAMSKPARFRTDL
jgi:hypothetical protein